MKILPYIHRIIIKRSNYTLNVIASFLLKKNTNTGGNLQVSHNKFKGKINV